MGEKILVGIWDSLKVRVCVEGKRIGKYGVDICCRNTDLDVLKVVRLWGKLVFLFLVLK